MKTSKQIAKKMNVDHSELMKFYWHLEESIVTNRELIKCTLVIDDKGNWLNDVSESLKFAFCVHFNKLDILNEKLIINTLQQLIIKMKPQHMYSPQDKVKKDLQIGKWTVKKNGDMEFEEGRYFINGDQLTENDWIAHLFEKDWIDFNEFLPAYLQALKNVGKQFVNVRVFY